MSKESYLNETYPGISGGLNLKVTIVIPSYNEEKNMSDIITKIKSDYENILVVDSKKSKDKTAEVAKEAGAVVIKDGGKGKGEALRRAIRHVDDGIIVFIDSDGSHATEDIPKLIKPIQEGRADMVVASRMLGGSDELHGTLLNFIKTTGTGLIQLFINYRWRVELTDSENGFRAIKADVAKKLKLKANDFDIEQEMVMKALKKNFRVSEIASHEYPRKYGKAKLKLMKCGWKFAWRLFRDIW